MAAKASPPTRRTVDRIRALSKADLPAPLVVMLQICAIGRTLGTAVRPAFLMLEPGAHEANFTVWLGSELITGELRMLLGAGIWPGPPNAPSPSRILKDPRLPRFVAVTLYGSEADGLWADLWRQRLIRHGIYGAFTSPKGRIGIMLAHRGDDAPPFTPADVAFVEDCSPYVGQALDRGATATDEPSVAVETVHLRFTGEGKIAALSLFGAEMLRDLGGGGPGAGDLGRAIVEKAAAPLQATPLLEPSARANLTLAGGPEERAFRETRAAIVIGMTGQRPDRRNLPVALVQNGLGRYEFWPTLVVGLGGEAEVAASLTRFLPLLAMRLRGAVQVDASAREIQLLCALSTGGTLKAAAEDMGITEATARTLGKRLGMRVEESGLSATGQRLDAIGRAHWP